MLLQLERAQRLINLAGRILLYGPLKFKAVFGTCIASQSLQLYLCTE